MKALTFIDLNNPAQHEWLNQYLAKQGIMGYVQSKQELESRLNGLHLDTRTVTIQKLYKAHYSFFSRKKRGSKKMLNVNITEKCHQKLNDIHKSKYNGKSKSKGEIIELLINESLTPFLDEIKAEQSRRRAVSSDSSKKIVKDLTTELERIKSSKRVIITILELAIDYMKGSESRGKKINTYDIQKIITLALSALDDPEDIRRLNSKMPWGI